MLDELRKIWSEFYVKMLVLIILIVSMAAAIVPIRSFSAMESAESTNMFKGKDAVRVLKEQYENSKGQLSTDKINAVLRYYQSIPSQDLAYVESTIQYPGIINLLLDAYLSVNTDESTNLYKLKDADDFYNRNTVQITAVLNHSTNTYQPWEKDIVLEKAESIEKPFKMDFSRQWVFAYRLLTLVFIVIAISAIIIGSRIFSYEKEKNMDMILVTISNKKLRNIARNKVFALLTFLTIEFLISMIILTVIFFSVTGFSAWSSQIQIEYFTSVYKLTFGSAYLLFIFMGWISIMTIGVLVGTINALTQKSYSSLVIGFTFVFIPLIITRLGSIPVSVKVFSGATG